MTTDLTGLPLDERESSDIELRLRRSVRAGIWKRLLRRLAPAALIFVIFGSVLIEVAKRLLLTGSAPPSPVIAVLLTVAILCPMVILSGKHMLALAVNLEMAHLELLGVLSRAIAKRDDATEEHNFRVAVMAVLLAAAAGVERRRIPGLFIGALLHDVGKIGVPDGILLKPGQLSTAEHGQMEQHVNYGVEILTDTNLPSGAKAVVQYHHERFDGSGYPDGRKGAEIPPEARLFAIVDVFDALTSTRPYKQAMNLQEALWTLERDRSGFDPGYLGTFMTIAPALHREVVGITPDKLKELVLRTIEIYYVREFPAAALDPRGEIEALQGRA